MKDLQDNDKEHDWKRVIQAFSNTATIRSSEVVYQEFCEKWGSILPKKRRMGTHHGWFGKKK